MAISWTRLPRRLSSKHIRVVHVLRLQRLASISQHFHCLTWRRSILKPSGTSMESTEPGGRSRHLAYKFEPVYIDWRVQKTRSARPAPVCSPAPPFFPWIKKGNQVTAIIFEGWIACMCYLLQAYSAAGTLQQSTDTPHIVGSFGS